MVIFEWMMALLVLGRLYVAKTVWDSFIFLMAVVSGFGQYYLPLYHGIYLPMVVTPIVLGMMFWDFVVACWPCGQQRAENDESQQK